MSTAHGPGEPASVAVILVSTDERSFIVAAIESLYRCGARRRLEVVVVDNASTDGTAEEIARRWPQVKVLRQDRRRWLSPNLNLGIDATRAPYVMLCNSDIVFTPEAVDLLAGFLDDHPRAGIAAPRLLSPTGETWPTARRWYTLRSLLLLRIPGLPDPTCFPSAHRAFYCDWDYTQPRPVDWVLFAAAMVRRQAVDEVGPMDDRFRIYFGDVDLALRMHQADWDVWCIPDATIVHHWQRASRLPLSKAWFSHLDSLTHFLVKHKGLRPRPANRSAEPTFRA